MRKTIKAISIKALALTFGLGMLYSCISDPDSPGLVYMPDMERSPAIEPYVDYGFIKERTNVELTMKQSALHPPMNTIRYYGNIEDLEIYLPYQREASFIATTTHGLRPEHGWKLSDGGAGDYAGAAKDDKNPIVLTAENEEKIFNSGKELYTINCAHCHGKAGDGKGPMVESGAYMGVPDYKNMNVTDGQMFFSIYYGRNMMGAHATLLNNYEIWTLVHYIHKLMDEDYSAETQFGTTEGDSVEGEEANVETGEETVEN